MSYLPISDASLAQRAELVVLGEIGKAAGPEQLDATYYELSVEEVLKGATGQRSIRVRVPGAADAQRAGALVVPGAPGFAQAERVLLFLVRRGATDYEVSELSLGAFHVRQASSGEALLVRDLSGAEELGAEAGAKAELVSQVRDLDKFRAWLRRDAGAEAPAEVSYWSTAQLADDARKFATSGSPPARWFEFDDGRTVTFYSGVADQLGLLSASHDYFQQALRAWTDDPGSRVLLTYGGTTAANAGLGSTDGVSQILFNDPRGELAGAFDCSRGGVLAIGMWRSSGVRQFRGQSFQAITEGDIVVQDGAGCALSSLLTRSGPETFAHEVGHLLGLAHSCGDSGQAACVGGSAADAALMRPSLHIDGRGAALAADDRAGIAYLYPAPGAASTTPPPPDPAPGDSSAAAASGGGGGALGAGVLALLLLVRLSLGQSAAGRSRPAAAPTRLA